MSQALCKCGAALPPNRKACDKCIAETKKRSRAKQKEGYKCNRLDLPRMLPAKKADTLDRDLLATDLAHITRVFCDIGQSGPCVSLRGTEFDLAAASYLKREEQTTSVRRTSFPFSGGF
jgi:hypothetical protein